MGNLFGDAGDRFVGLHNHGNTIGSNTADGVGLFFGLTEPSKLTECDSEAEDFLATARTWNVLDPASREVMSATDLKSFVTLTRAQLKCVLDFDKDYTEAADLAFILEELFKALDLRLLVDC